MDPATLFLLAVMNLSIHFDHVQTLHAADEPAKYYETNKHIGEHPTRGRVNRWFIASHVVNTGIVLALPKKWGWGYAVGVTVIETGYVMRNRAIGVQVKF